MSYKRLGQVTGYSNIAVGSVAGQERHNGGYGEQVTDAVPGSNPSVAGTVALANSGTAQAGAASSLTLAAGASATSDIYTLLTLVLTGGTGTGQSRTISAYNGSTKVATVDSAWSVTPDGTTTYEVRGLTGIYENHPARTSAAANPEIA